MIPFDLNLTVNGGRPFLVVLLGVLFWSGGSPVEAQVQPDPQPPDSVQDAPAQPPPAAPPDSVRAEDVAPPDTSEPERAVVTADSLSAQTRRGMRVQELFDNVRVRQDTTRLQSNYGLRYLNTDELLFTGDVVIYERGDTLRADTVRYNKKTKVGHARSNVQLTDGDVTVHAPRATYYTEEKRSVFPDSVTLVDSNRVLRAESGTYWSNEQRAEFQGNVHLTDPETYLESDSLTYYRDQERSIAVGRVFIRRVGRNEEAPEDTTTRTYLFGDWADNQEKNRYSHVRGEALLVRVRMDSTGAPEDTLVVRGKRLEAFRTDTYRRLIAVDSVRIWQSDLAAVADSTVYDRIVATGAEDSTQAPSPLPDSARESRAPPLSEPVASGDSLGGPRAPPTSETADSLATVADDSTDRSVGLPDSTGSAADSLQAPSDDTTETIAVDTSETTPADTSQAAPEEVQARANPDSTGVPDDSTAGESASGRGWDRPIAQTEDVLPLEESRLFQDPVTWFERSQVWGDSIRVRSHNRSLDTVFVRSSAFAAQEDTTLDRIQQLKGRDITAFFKSDSLRRILARPNAQAIRFLATDDGALNGGAKASGDRIALRFRDGSVERTSVIGGVESTYYRTPEAIPDPFRLEGFQWTPERKPTKDGLLREERVRERLDLGPRSTPPPIARRSGPPVPDSSSEGNGSAPSDVTNLVEGSSTGELPPIPSDSLSTPIDSSQTRRRRSPTDPPDTTQTPDSRP